MVGECSRDVARTDDRFLPQTATAHEQGFRGFFLQMGNFLKIPRDPMVEPNTDSAPVFKTGAVV
jgi:hypothetical protein